MNNIFLIKMASTIFILSGIVTLLAEIIGPPLTDTYFFLYTYSALITASLVSISWAVYASVNLNKEDKRGGIK